MSIVTTEGLARYFANLPTFNAELDKVEKRRGRWMPWALAAALVTVVAQAGTIKGMLPLKTTTYIPIVFHEDGSIIPHLSIRDLSVKQQQASINGQLQQYMYCREGYAIAIAKRCYKTVEAMSSKRVLDEFDNEFDYQKNKNSVQNTVGEHGKVDVDVLDIDPVRDGVFRVPYRRTETTRYGQTPKVTYWTAIFQIELIDQISNNNPVGVIVTSYDRRRDTPPNETRTSP